MQYTISMSGSDQQYVVIQMTSIHNSSEESYNSSLHDLFLDTIIHMNEVNWSFSPPMLRTDGLRESTIADHRLGSHTYSCKVYDNNEERAQKTLSRIRDFYEHALSILRTTF